MWGVIGRDENSWGPKASWDERVSLSSDRWCGGVEELGGGGVSGGGAVGNTTPFFVFCIPLPPEKFPLFIVRLIGSLKPYP